MVTSTSKPQICIDRMGRGGTSEALRSCSSRLVGFVPFRCPWSCMLR